MIRNFIDNLDRNVIHQIDELRNETAPIYIMGAGAHADDVFDYCTQNNIKISGFFVTQGEVKNVFRDLPCVWFANIDKKVEIVVIVGNSHYKECEAFLKPYSFIKKVYMLASCCCCKDAISYDFITSNNDSICRAYNLLEDEISKKNYVKYFESRYYDDVRLAYDVLENSVSYYVNDVIELGNNESLLDIGSSTGHATWPFIEATKNQYKMIVALEPENDNYNRMLNYIERKEIERIRLIKKSAYNQNCNIVFSVPGGNESGGIISGEHTLSGFSFVSEAIKVDDLCKDINFWPTIVKLNFPFSVQEIIDGMRNLIEHNKPKVIIRAGLMEDVLIDTLIHLSTINPNYKFYLRYTLGVPQGLTLFAI